MKITKRNKKILWIKARLKRLRFSKSKPFILLVIVNLFFCLACEKPIERAYKQAKEEIEAGKFRLALEELDKIIIRWPEEKLSFQALKDAARISFFDLKDYKKALYYYRELVLLSPDPLERLFSQKQIANINFDHLSDYKKSIIEISKVLNMMKNNEGSYENKEKVKYKTILARAYFYQNNFFQAESEIEEILKISSDPEEVFESNLIKGNIYVTQKEISKAILIYKELFQKYPLKAKKENIGLSLAICYEEIQDYKSAIKILEEIKTSHSSPEYIELRIKKLSQRLKNMPVLKVKSKSKRK